jgi:hypothetical protein
VGKVPGNLSPCCEGQGVALRDPGPASVPWGERVRAWLGSVAAWADARLAPAPAVAEGDGGYCYPLRELVGKVGSCSANALFTQAAELCLARIDQESRLAARPLEAQTATGAAAGPAGRIRQTTTLASSERALAEARAELALVKARAAFALSDVDYYSQVLVWPHPVAAGSNDEMFAALMKEPCFGDNETRLESARRRLVQDIAQLEAATQVARALETGDATARAHLGASAPTATARGTHGVGRGTASVPAARPDRHGSTITGKVHQEDEILEGYRKGGGLTP